MATPIPGGVSRPLCLRNERGNVVDGDGWRWIGPTTCEDERLLDRVVAPVLDIGCGPARHLLALAGRGIDGLGLDVTPSAVRLARSRGAAVVEGSIFATVTGEGSWGTALLLDGNIGIGGDPVALLVRVKEVLRPGGRILVELDPPGTASATERARLHHHAATGPWFDWTVVSAASIAGIALDAGLEVTDSWSAGGRWFAQIDTAAT
ncbi:MAG: class I SAM-dependent methyltransferase [Acidimicrobiales bacterium]